MSDRPVFIAYVEGDSAVALGLAAELRQLGHATWTYEENGVAGFSYLEQVHTAIQECQAFILLASKSSLDSHQVHREAETAYEHRKRIIPLRLHISQDEMRSSSIFRMASGTAVSLLTDGTNLRDVAARIDASLTRVVASRTPPTAPTGRSPDSTTPSANIDKPSVRPELVAEHGVKSAFEQARIHSF